MAKTKIAAVQMNVEIGQVATNREHIIKEIKSVAAQGAQLVIFPECALTGYCFDSLEEAKPFAETINGESAQAITQVCKETGVHVIAGFIEQDGDSYFNAAMLVTPDGISGTYRKVHLPFLGVDRFLTPGSRPFHVFETTLGRIGMNICYDINFPEAPRALKLLGAELFVLPTNWPEGAWRTPKFMLNARAQENHINLVAVNRVGIERGWRFIGQSKIVDCNGDIIVEASADKEEILFAEIDIQAANQNKIVNVAGAYEMDRIADRRPEFYAPVAQTAEGTKQKAVGGSQESESRIQK